VTTVRLRSMSMIFTSRIYRSRSLDARLEVEVVPLGRHERIQAAEILG